MSHARLLSLLKDFRHVDQGIALAEALGATGALIQVMQGGNPRCAAAVAPHVPAPIRSLLVDPTVPPDADALREALDRLEPFAFDVLALTPVWRAVLLCRDDAELRLTCDLPARIADLAPHADHPAAAAAITHLARLPGASAYLREAWGVQGSPALLAALAATGRDAAGIRASLDDGDILTFWGEAALLRTPISALGCDPARVYVLQRMGFRTILDVLRAPYRQLSRRGKLMTKGAAQLRWALAEHGLVFRDRLPPIDLIAPGALHR